MHQLKKLLTPTVNYSTIDYSKKIFNNYSTIVKTPQTNVCSITKKEADKIIETVSDLIDDSKYLPFFFKRLYAIGPDRFFQAYDQAKKGKQPARLFVSLLK